MSLDPRSDKVALYYTGDDGGRPAVKDVPARDLTENDIARLVRVEHGDLSGAAFDATADAIVTRLTAGPYRKTKPEAPAAKKKDTPAEPPVTEPEV